MAPVVAPWVGFYRGGAKVADPQVVKPRLREPSRDAAGMDSIAVTARLAPTKSDNQGQNNSDLNQQQGQVHGNDLIGFIDHLETFF